MYLAGDNRVETEHVIGCGLSHVDVAIAVAFCLLQHLHVQIDVPTVY